MKFNHQIIKKKNIKTLKRKEKMKIQKNIY